MKIPKVFISYSHDTIQHKQWVLQLATRMRNNGIDAIIDQWELKPGDDLPHFMETHLADSDKVVMVCTENYVAKANSGTGGVGYEKMIVTSSLLNKISENKIIPIVRQTSTKDTPTFLKSKLFIDFSKDDQHEFSFDELIRTIHNSPLYQKPEIGNNPFKEVTNSDIKPNNDVIFKLMTLICAEYDGNGWGIYLSDLKISLNISRIGLEVLINQLVNLDYVTHHNDNIILKEKGKQYAINNNIA